MFLRKKAQVRKRQIIIFAYQLFWPRGILQAALDSKESSLGFLGIFGAFPGCLGTDAQPEHCCQGGQHWLLLWMGKQACPR